MWSSFFFVNYFADFVEGFDVDLAQFSLVIGADVEGENVAGFHRAQKILIDFLCQIERAGGCERSEIFIFLRLSYVDLCGSF